MEKINEGYIKSINDFKGLTARDCADILFLSLVALQIMKYEFNFISRSKDYARKTMQMVNFKKWNSGSTDLYALLFVIQNKDISGLKPSGDNKTLMKRIWINQTHMSLHLRELGMGSINVQREKLFFYDLENSLMITDSNYKSMRKLCTDWINLTQKQKELLVTRLIQAFRVRFPRMDLRDSLEYFVGSRALERDNVRNIEQERSEKEHQLKVIKLLAAKKKRDETGTNF
jgi:hypothetical protein